MILSLTFIYYLTWERAGQAALKLFENLKDQYSSPESDDDNDNDDDSIQVIIFSRNLLMLDEVQQKNSYKRSRDSLGSALFQSFKRHL